MNTAKKSGFFVRAQGAGRPSWARRARIFAGMAVLALGALLGAAPASLAATIGANGKTAAPVVAEKGPEASPEGQATGAPAGPGEEEWIAMPENGRLTYPGIHGGTAPVTVYAAPQGAWQAVPGETHNDFLKLLTPKDGGDPPAPQAGYDWNAMGAPAAGVPLGLAPLTPQEWIVAETRRLAWLAEQRQRHIAALLELAPLQKVYRFPDRRTFAPCGPRETELDRLRRLLGVAKEGGEHPAGSQATAPAPTPRPPARE